LEYFRFQGIIREKRDYDRERERRRRRRRRGTRILILIEFGSGYKEIIKKKGK